MGVILTLFVMSAGYAMPDGSANSSVNSSEKSDKTLSPYFQITQGDPESQAFPLKSTDVSVNVVGVIADVVVTQRYVNEGESPIHAKYVFPASTRAAVHGLTMQIGDRRVVAKIQERKAAEKKFEEAKKAGKSAALLNQERPNVFTMNLANIMPGDEVEVELRYTEHLIPTQGTYEFVYPTVVGPRYSSQPEAEAAASDRWVKSPYLKQGHSPQSRFGIQVRVAGGLPLEELLCDTHATQVSWPDQNTAAITLDPSETAAGNRDFILKYRLTGRQINSGLMVYEGKDENFFMMTVQPPQTVRQEDITPREYLFVVDVSGSMTGFPLDESKKLMEDLFDGLRPTDRFNLLLFSGTSYLMASESLPATAETLNRARKLLDKQRGGGGTELQSALDRVMRLPHREGYSRSIVVVTDGYIAADTELLKSVQKRLNQANLFAFGIGSSVNRYVIEGLAQAGMGEPFVVTRREEASEMARQFREYIQSPVLSGIQVMFDGFEAYDVEPAALPDLFADRPLVVYGKWNGPAQGKIVLKGYSGEGEFVKSFDVQEHAPQEQNSPLRYLWARKRIATLSNPKFHLGEGFAKEAVTQLGLKYNLLTPYTSFIAVHEQVRNPGGDAKEVNQPLPLPQGVSELAVSSVMNTPEPEFYLIVVVALMLPLGVWEKRRRARRRLNQRINRRIFHRGHWFDRRDPLVIQPSSKWL
jgi:Ca-activated chloride channel family protein